MTSLFVFDLDHTLLRCNISFAFGAHLFRVRSLSFWQAARCCCYYVRYKWLQPCTERLHTSVLRTFLKGRGEKEVILEAERFLDQCLATLLYDPMMNRLEEAKEKGRVLLLSGSPHFLVAPLAKRLGIAWAATDYQTDEEGKLDSIGRYMNGYEKRRYIEAMCKESKIDPEKVCCYTDSIADLPLLNFVGKKVAVRPCRKLRALSYREGWEVVS